MSIFDEYVNSGALHAFKLTNSATLPNMGLSTKTASVTGGSSSNGLPLWAGGDKPLSFNTQASVKITDTLGPDRTMECLYVPSDQDAGLIMRNGQVSVEEIGGVLKLNLFPKSPDDGQVVEMNNVVDLSQWVLSGAGASYEDGTITLTQSGDKAVSPLYRMGDGDTLWKLGGEFWGTPDSPNVDWAGDAARLLNSTYFAADGVTMATNGEGYTGNGNAQHFPAYEWTKPDDATAWIMGGQTGITYVRFTLTRDTTWSSTTIKMRNAQFMTSVGTTPAMNDTNTFSGLTPPDSKYHYEFDTEGHSLKVEDYSSSPLQETIEWDREQSLIALMLSHSSVTLWCNGESTSIDLDDIVWEDDDFFTLSPDGGYADAFALYNKVVSMDTLQRHWDASRDTPAYDSVLNSLIPAQVLLPAYVDEASVPEDGFDTAPPPIPFGYYMGNDDYRIVTDEHLFTTDDDFLSAEYDTVEVGDDMVVGDSGYWTTSVLKPETPSKIEWVGNSVSVTLSADGGVNWTPVDNNSVIPTLVESADVGTMDIRVDFSTGGTLSSLNVVTYQDNTLQGDMTERLVLLNGAVTTADDVNYPIEQNPLAGFKFAGGSATIQTSADTDTVQSIMFWIKPEGTVDGTLLTMGGTTVSTSGGAISGTAYVNGAVGTLKAGVWNHVIITNLPASNADIVITPPVGQLNMLTIMNETVDASDASFIYNSFFGYPKYSWLDDTLSISEPATAYTYVQDDWGITSSY